VALVAAAGITGLVLTGATAAVASGRPDSGIDTRSSTVSTTVPIIARIGAQIVRCDTGEGNLSGAGALAPLTLSDITTCSQAIPTSSSAAQARQLEHDPLR
jgi:hypothetical protein